jgi:competence protein ComGA
MEISLTIQLVNDILADAVVRKASEICLEPRVRDVAVLYTVNGKATEVASLPRPIEQKVFNRFVTLAGKDYWRPGPARHGTIEVHYHGKPCRFALTFEPGMVSEDLVLRRLPS